MFLQLFYAFAGTFGATTKVQLSNLARSLLFLMIVLSLGSCRYASEPNNPEVERTGILAGSVRDVRGPVSGAIVRVQTTVQHTISDEQGRFILTRLIPEKTVTITAWAPGYYIGGGQEYLPGYKDVELILTPHHTEDNPDYQWLSAFSKAGKEGNCENCHSEPGHPNSALPFDEWQHDAHANAAQNPRFLTMYTGKDVYGNQSPLTRFGYSRDYGNFPLAPDPNEPYFGPGYKLDFPATSGNCAACHTPAAAINVPYGVNPTEVDSVGAEGIGCDFCHKVWDVRLNLSTGLPYNNMPGMLSFEYRRPPEGHQFFAGPFDDVAPGEDVYSHLQNQSQYCAPCHFGSFWDTEIYNSFGEWLDSPYSAPQSGKTCQDCHMPTGLTDHFVRFDKGGKQRNPSTIFSHRMLGVMDEEFLRNAVTINTSARFDGNIVVVQVEIVNDKTGHHLPTDSPLRHLILLVQATDANGDTLLHMTGPTVPAWGGVGDPNAGYYAGQPGSAYAKILEEMWTGVSPTGAYWNMTRIISDNRIPALGRDATNYTFAAPVSGVVTVDVRLVFRRAFIELVNWKSWNVPDVVMAQQTRMISPN